MIFHIAYVTSILALSLLLIEPDLHGSDIKGPLLVSAWVLTLSLMAPLRLPEGIVANYPDMIYELQIVRHIVQLGKVTFQPYTRYAAGYIFNPILELLVAMIGTILGADYGTVLKYAGPFMNIITVLLLLIFYRRFLSKKDATISVLLATSCFHFISFDPSTVHETLALPFLFAIPYTLTKSGRAWRAITLLLMFMVVSTHYFTAIVGLFYFIAASIAICLFSFMTKRPFGPVERTTMRIPVPFALITIVWLLYVTPSVLVTGVIPVASYAFFMLTSLRAEVVFPLVARGIVSVPTWIRAVGDLGIVLFGATITIGFLLALRDRWYSRLGLALPFASSSAAIFSAALLIYSKYSEAIDLLPRAYTYVYFSAAPLSLLAMKRASLSFRGGIYRKLLCTLLMFLVVSAAVYYNYPRYLYDNTAPLTSEDVRFPLNEWKSAGLFARDHLTSNFTIWGDRIAFSFVGGYGDKNVETLPSDMNMTLAQWVDTYPRSGDILILRGSMPDAPYLNYEVTRGELNRILQSANVVYSSGEVLMLAEQ